MSKPQFCVGIDLGTTHCAVASQTLDGPVGSPDTGITEFKIPQVVAPGQVQSRSLLPSFLYLPHTSELAPGALALPWDANPASVVGEQARTAGAKTPLRLVSSAKSWLCHAGVDRRAPLLPLNAPDDVEKCSPLDASIGYLSHLRSAWNSAHPEAPLAEQEVTITVPASFDPVARNLTVEAAQAAGLANAVLLEEPQAALYSWISRTGDDFRNQVQVGDVILVVDVGGGTSDFSLIAVEDQGGELQLRRLAVGDHILLGGDNMDLALAYFLRGKLEQEGRKLDASQLAALTQAVRPAKERLLGQASPQANVQSVPVVIPGKGSKLIGGSIRTELSRDDLQRILLDGFFPEVESSAAPPVRPQGGLRQLGLPYAQDAAITRHLAAFLSRQQQSLTGTQQSAHPTAVLFNGGVFKSDLLRQRVCTQLNRFSEATGTAAIVELSGADLDLSVSRGAACFGRVKQGAGLRIRGGTAMAYYVGVESAMPAVPGMATPLSALCVAPFGLEEGTDANIPEAEFGLMVGQPVRFQFFGSSVRRDDLAGTLIDEVSSEELTPLQDIEVTLTATQNADKVELGTVTVGLQAGVTEVGTLQLFAVAKRDGQRWRIELNTRETP